MLGLAAQKFVGDIAKDAYAFARTRITTGPGRMPGPNAGLHGSAKSKVRMEMKGMSIVIRWDITLFDLN